MTPLAALCWAKFKAQDAGFIGLADAFDQMIREEIENNLPARRSSSKDSESPSLSECKSQPPTTSTTNK